MSFGSIHRTVRVIHPRATLLIEGGFRLYLFLTLLHNSLILASFWLNGAILKIKHFLNEWLNKAKVE